MTLDIYKLAQTFVSNTPDCTISENEMEEMLDQAAKDGTLANDHETFLKMGLRYYDSLDVGAYKKLAGVAGKLGIQVYYAPVRLALAAELNDVRNGTKVLSTKSRECDNDVYLIQRALLAIARFESNESFVLKGFGADGIFGPETDRAVRAFQKSRGLTVDGDIGPKTLKALSDAIESRYPHQQQPQQQAHNNTGCKPWEINKFRKP